MAAGALYYVNQLEHADIPYVTGINVSPAERRRMVEEANIKCAGCGLCSGSMLIAELTGRRLTLEEYRDLSYLCGANLEPGTDMRIYGTALAQRFGIWMEMTDDADMLIRCLRTKGRAIINVGGDRPGYKGIFSDVGHYIFARGYLEESAEIEILDPAFRAGKFDGNELEGRVRTKGFICYAGIDVLKRETDNRSPGYYLFWGNS